ncbi:MAG: prepilin-type N-terminal cleavage/methylation domain-containing protein [Alphaproteobacteria bacterium]|nr:prepilin-type N-terminal cleavage/methylation domain-containing protein [Alphaproteobacteria bacterium]
MAQGINRLRAGFTILEMSIVLSVLALIIGGVLAGKALIDNAEIKNVVQQAGQLSLATNQFYVEYQKYPGDMDNATQFWGEAHPNASTCKQMDKTDMRETCDGDGDGIIDQGNYELFLVWQQLKNANYIDGSYSGTANHNCTNLPGPCNLSHLPGVNSPIARLNGISAGWGMKNVFYQDGTNPSGNWFLGDYGHTLLFGAPHTGNALPINPTMTPRQAWSLDKKIDDGKPAQGTIVTRTADYNPVENCTVEFEGSENPSDLNDLDAAYKLSEDGIACNFMLRRLFQ